MPVVRVTCRCKNRKKCYNPFVRRAIASKFLPRPASIFVWTNYLCHHRSGLQISDICRISTLYNCTSNPKWLRSAPADLKAVSGAWPIKKGGRLWDSKKQTQVNTNSFYGLRLISQCWCWWSVCQPDCNSKQGPTSVRKQHKFWHQSPGLAADNFC